MNEQEVIQIALENLEKFTPIRTESLLDTLVPNHPNKIHLRFENKRIAFNVFVKRELRNHEVPTIINEAIIQRPLLVVAQRIFPKIKEQLRENHIAYLEANGNIFFNEQGCYVLIEGNKPFTIEREKSNRAFTKTGLKVLFYFLLNENFVNRPYRDIASIANVGLGNINYVITGLKEMGFLLDLNKQELKLINKKKLLEKWMVAYGERLKPSLFLGAFKFLKEDDFYNWKNIHLTNQKTLWGGEPAGDFFTHHLRPGELTMYTTELKNDLIKNYRLVPDDNGNVKVYRKFWNYDEVNYDVVPPLLAYTDLINTHDKRCIETAQIIYDQLLRNNF